MSFIILFLLLLPTFYGLFKMFTSIYEVIEENHREKKAKKAQRLADRYPNAFREKFGTAYVPSDTKRDVLNQMLNINTHEFEIKEEAIRTRLAKEEAERKRIQAELDAKYSTLVANYPNGVESFKKIHDHATMQQIISSESEVARLDDAFIKNQQILSWNSKQKELSKTARSLYTKHLGGFGCCKYNISINGIDEYGNKTDVDFLVWQMFCDAYCGNPDLDYGERVYLKDNQSSISDLCAENSLYQQKYYDEVVEFIKELPGSPKVLLSKNEDFDNDISHSEYGFELESFSQNHFEYLKTRLDTNEIKYYALSDTSSDDSLQEFYPNQTIVIVEILTRVKRFFDTCKSFLTSHNSVSPCIVYISMLKEYSSEELTSIVASDRKKEMERIENERREQEEAERRKLTELSHTFKEDANDFKRYLFNNGISCLYHFTDKANLSSIKERGGLLSWKYCIDHGISIHNAGGSEESRSLDRRHGLEDYVRLSFCDDHPMAWRLNQQGANLVLLKIKIDVAWLQDTLFSDINATDNNHHHGKTLADLQRVDINATRQHFVSSSAPIFKKHQAEVLVKTFIPLEYIENINNPILLFDGNDYRSENNNPRGRYDDLLDDLPF